VEFAGLPDFVKRECTVLAARPGDQRLRPRCHLRHQLNEAPRVRRRWPGRSGAAMESLSAPIFFSAASAARSPLSQAPSTVPHRVSWLASPARKRLPSGSVRIFREPCAPGAATDIAPSVNGEAFQRVTLD